MAKMRTLAIFQADPTGDLFVWVGNAEDPPSDWMSLIGSVDGVVRVYRKPGASCKFAIELDPRYDREEVMAEIGILSLPE